MSDSEREHEEEEKSGGFKVTDRRLFTPEGERRSDAEEPPKKAEERRPPPAGVVPEQAPAEEPHFAGPLEPHGPVSFEHLVMSLATTAMFQLGLVKSPEEEQPRADLIAAKETIDLLEILQQKTKGNLTEAEERLLTGSLYELRMVFVELSSKAGRGR